MEYSRIRDFIISFSKDDEGELGEIYEKAVSDGVPVIRPEMRDYMKVMLRQIKPSRVLEVGTAVGYSSLMMATTLDSMDVDFHIDTCELDEERIQTASENIIKMNYENRITIHKGDAAESMKALDGEYDLIFIDAAKAQYMNYLLEAIRLSRSGTVIVTDNILADGDVLESHFLVEKRDRTIHDRMREYVYEIKNNERLETAILSVGDGVAVSVVK